MKDQINQARWLAVLAATGIGLYLCWLMLKPFIGVLEWAIVLVIVFHPVHRRLASKIKSRGLSALLSCILVILLAVLPLTLLTIAVARELAHVVPTLPTQISQFMNTQTPLFARISDWLQTRFGIDTLRSQEFLSSSPFLVASVFSDCWASYSALSFLPLHLDCCKPSGLQSPNP